MPATTKQSPYVRAATRKAKRLAHTHVQYTHTSTRVHEGASICGLAYYFSRERFSVWKTCGAEIRVET